MVVDASCSAKKIPEPEAGAALGFLRFAAGFWFSGTAAKAWLFAMAVLVLLLLNLAVNIGINRWHRWFFDMLEQRQAGKLLLAISTLGALVLVGAAFAVAMVKCRMTVQIDWRRWVTDQIIKSWIARSYAGSTFVTNQSHGSPEYRIVEDIRLALDPIVDLSIGFANALIQGVTFLGILVIVGGSLSLTLFGFDIAIPAYLAIAAVAYAAIVSTAIFLVGQPLVRRIAEKNEAEARFLFELTRAAESGALKTPAVAARRAFRPAISGFHRVIGRWRRVIHEHCRLTWLTNSNTFFAPVLPLLLAAPNYINGRLSLGAVMQVAVAFTIVLGALNWLTDNYIRLAEWSASAKRVDELRHALLMPGNGQTNA